MATTKSNQDAFMQNIRAALGRSGKNIEKREAALFTAGKIPAPEEEQYLQTIRSRGEHERLELLETLKKEGEPLNITVIPHKDVASVSTAISELVAQTSPEWGDKKSVVQWDHPLVNSLNLSHALADLNVPVHTAAFSDELKQAMNTEISEIGTGATTNEGCLKEATCQERDKQKASIRQEVTDAYIGVTSADFCLADTATLVMKSRPGEARSVSLVPSIHVAVIHLDQMLFDMKELYALLKHDPDQQAEGIPHHMVFVSGPSKTADIELVMVHGAHGPRALYLHVITG